MDHSPHQLVADAVYGVQITRIARLTLELCPQGRDMIVHGSCALRSFVAPDRLQQLFACYYASFARREQLQHAELLARQIDRAIPTPRFIAPEIDDDVSDPQLRWKIRP